jgi:4-hydroxymandelate oxidase
MAPDDGGPPAPGPAPLGTSPLAQRRRGADPDGQTGELDLAALEAEARAALPRDVADYYAGGAGSEITLDEATAAWESWRLRPAWPTSGRCRGTR